MKTDTSMAPKHFGSKPKAKPLKNYVYLTLHVGSVVDGLRKRSLGRPATPRG